MYIYLDKQGIVKEIINDEALRQSSSNVNEIYVYYDGLQENDIGSVLATYGLPDGTITDEMEVATRTEENEIPYDAERDLKYFQYYKAYAFYHFAIADLALSQEGVVRLMVRLAQKDGEYIKVAGLICFDVEGELVKEDHGVSLAQYNYLVKAWYETKECLPLDGSKAMQGNIDMGAHNVLFNGKTLKDNNGALNYNGSDLAKQSDTSSLQSQIDTINATQNVVDIVGTKAELNAYATNNLHANDKIEVLADESQSNANTIYEWNGNAWLLVGSKAPYYSKAESDTRYNELKAKSYDKDTTEYVTGHVPDSALVKGSFDSVNEKVVALQADNQTTKTTIAGLVSGHNKNAQDIDNISAVMPTDINVDSEYNFILEHDGTEITGQKKNLMSHWDFYNYHSTIFKETLSSIVVSQIDGKVRKGNITLGEGNYDSNLKRANAVIKLTPTIDGDIPTNYHYGKIEYEYFSDLLKLTNKSGSFSTSFIIPLPSGNSISIRLPNNKSGTLALVEDLNAKQNTLHRHAITITNGNGVFFNGEVTISSETEINTPELFIREVGSRFVSFNGFGFVLIDNKPFLMYTLEIRDTLQHSALYGVYTSDGSTDNQGNIHIFEELFGTTGITIADEVSPKL